MPHNVKHNKMPTAPKVRQCQKCQTQHNTNSTKHNTMPTVQNATYCQQFQIRHYNAKSYQMPTNTNKCELHKRNGTQEKVNKKGLKSAHG